MSDPYHPSPSGQPPPPAPGSDEWTSPPPGQRIPSQGPPGYGAPPPAYGPPGYGPPGYGPPGYGPPGYPPGPQEARGTNVFSILALVSGILAPCLALFSLIFGILALVQIRRSGQKGKGLAIGGLVLTGAWAVLAVVGVTVAVLTAGAERGEDGEIVEGGDVTTDELAVGDCLNGLDSGEVVTRLPGVPCAEPHEGEVYALFDVSMEGDWPGDDPILAEADAGCDQRLQEYSQTAYDDLSVDIFYLYPSEQTWEVGDREVICVAYFLDGTRTGSLAG